MAIVSVIFAFILILKGGDLLVESSVWLAKKAKIPSIIVGATIVAIATTFPEISVSIISGVSGLESIAINTALGSMISNFTLVLGLSFLVCPSKIYGGRLKSKLVFYIFAIMLLTIVALDQKVTRFDAILLLLFFIAFVIFNIFDARNSVEEETKEFLPSWFITITQFVISALAIGFGANVLVASIDELSVIFGINEGLLGVFIIAVGTNIPEFVTTMTAIKMGNAEMGIGNIFGSSLIDATILIALTALSKASGWVTIPIKLLILTMLLLLVIVLVVAVPIIKKSKSSRVQGLTLIVIFLIYSLLLIKII